MDEESGLRELLAQSPHGVSIITRDHFERLFINTRMIELLGIKGQEDTPGIDTFVNPAEFEHMMRQFAAGKTIDGTEHARRRIDNGEIWWSLVHGRPTEFEGREAGIMWVTDITPRKMTEFKLERLTSAQSDWLWEIDEKLNIVSFSENFYERSGFKKDQICGMNMRAFGELQRVNPETFARLMDDLEARKPISNVEFERWDGAENQWIRLNAAPVWEDNVFSGYYGSTTDITELRKTQNRLVNTERAVALGGMVAGVAHEINTPLGVAVTALSVLESEFSRIKSKYEEGKFSRSAFESFLETGGEGFSMLRENLRRAAELVQNFKQVAVDQSSDAPRRINLKNYIESVISNLSPRLKPTRHAVIVEGDDDIDIDTYPGAIAQIITNFLENSILHAYDDGQVGAIKIAITQRADDIRVVYADDGKGMPPEIVRRVFEPFFTTARGQGGSGLGMHIIQNLVTQRLNGSIDCTSTVGHGIKVEIVMPKTIKGMST
jgi:PAS domain S-box-containing protein